MRARRLFALAVLAAGCNDTTVKVYREPPQVIIIEPSEGTSFYTGQAVLFRAQVETYDSTDLTEFTHYWVSGGETICAADGVPGDGYPTCSWSFDDADTHTVTIYVTHPSLETAEDTTTVVIEENTPPTVEITSPADGTGFEPSELIVLEALVSDAEDDADELVVTVTSSLDGELALTASPTSSGDWTAATYLSNGEHLITVRVTDTAGSSDQDTLTLAVNGRAGAPEVEIYPDPAISGESIKAIITADAVDPEDDGLIYRYDWYVDGALYSSGTNPAVPDGETIRDEYWEVEVFADDGYGVGDPATAGIVIDTSAPSIDSVLLEPDPADTTNDIIATPDGWFDQDGDSAKYRYRWYLNGSLDSSITSATYPSSRTERGDELQVSVTPYDAFEDGDSVLSGVVEIENSAPTEPGVTVTPTSPEPEDNLTCSVTTDSTDADGDSINYFYRWYKDGVEHTVTTYVVSSSYTSHGETWTCEVTPSDGTDRGTPGTDSVTINDGTAPDAPVIDTPEPYRNEDEVELTGTCEADCLLTFFCADSSSAWSETDVCGSDGEFSHDVDLTRGDETTCYAICEDEAGNSSADSNDVSTESCDPYDEYEYLGATYGDSAATAINEWSAISDSGTTTITIEGNVLDDSDADWYVISTTDSVSADRPAGYDLYNFEVFCC